MGWNSTGGFSSSDWVLTGSIMTVRTGRPVSGIYTLNYTGASYNWKENKTYQFSTSVLNFHTGAAGSSFSMTPAWSDTLNFTPPTSPSQSVAVTPLANFKFYHYSSPPSTFNSTKYIEYKANGTFSVTGFRSTGIVGLTATEIDFSVQGSSFVRRIGYELIPSDQNSLGWYYDRPQDVYYWYDSTTNDQYPVGGSDNSKSANNGFRQNNYIGKFVSYGTFNLSFTSQNDSPFPFSVYLSSTLPNPIAGSFSKPGSLLGTIGSGLTYSAFYGLRGGQYIYFVGPYVGTASAGVTYSSLYLQNVKIEGGYHPGNNRQYLLTNSATYSDPTILQPIGLTGATYSSFVGTGNTVNATQSISLSQIFSKIGNGTFQSGVWENGVWNSGWRVDDGMFDFYDVYRQFSYSSSKRWRLQIIGPISSVEQFEIGDNISIGNIVAIDINNERVLIKNYFTIINKTEDTIIVEFDNNFPLRRVERDSENHRIYVTKNVWLSGGFLNGYFKGIWNYGLFKGYPLITEMYDSHWIDGIFDGGHFNAVKYPGGNFSDTLFTITSDYFGYVGLTSSSPHTLTQGDIITIDKTDKTVNPEYDGDHEVLSIVNDYHIIVDLQWGSNTTLESGSWTVNKSKGLVQNMIFRSNNKSKVTSVQSMTSESVFIYNSWIDVNYDNEKAVNIGKPQTLVNSLSQKTYSENNLYGYPTLDILSSDSSFRDSYSLSVRKYKLGTKYKIFNDFIGESSKFEDEFGATGSNDARFISYGWTYSRYSVSSLTFSRTVDTGNVPIIGEELRVDAIGSGGILDITKTEGILDRSTDNLERFRYTKVSFDVLDSTENYTFNEGVDKIGWYVDPKYTKSYIQTPSINFNNINKVRRLSYLADPFDPEVTTVYSSYIPATFLPIYQNVNHLLTTKQNKVEYFYNKRNLSMVFRGQPTETSTYIIDNLNFYEVDMIPFFKYFLQGNINSGVEVPFQGISPFIDYSNANFNFVDNISIGLDSIATQNSNTAISGVGIGIGSIGGIGGGIYAESSASGDMLASGGFSDIRLKEGIIKVGKSLLGINIYEWNYINENNRFRGVIAQELLGTEFENSLSIKQGFYWVDYTNLDIKFEMV
jgi:hypothetical protein